MDMGRRGNAESVLIAGNKTSEDGPANQYSLETSEVVETGR